MQEHAWLNHIERRIALFHRPNFRPRRALITRQLEVHAPAAWASFGARRRDPRAIAQDDGFVFHRTKDAIRQLPRSAPGFAAISRSLDHAPPTARRWADLVE